MLNAQLSALTLMVVFFGWLALTPEQYASPRDFAHWAGGLVMGWCLNTTLRWIWARPAAEKEQSNG